MTTPFDDPPVRAWNCPIHPQGTKVTLFTDGFGRQVRGYYAKCTVGDCRQFEQRQYGMCGPDRYPPFGWAE